MVANASSGPPAPVDDVHEICQSIVSDVMKLWPSTVDVDDAFRYVYEHVPGDFGSYMAIGPSPSQATAAGPFASPGSNVSLIGLAVTVAHNGPTDAVIETVRQLSPPARKSSGVRT